jgi:hypothetical protein
MATVIYQCPVTGFKVQGWVPEDVPETELEHTFIPMTCTVCTHTHLVHPLTGKVLASDDE